MRPAQLDGLRVIYDGVDSRHFGTCPWDEMRSFCCQCTSQGQWVEICRPYTQAEVDECEHSMQYWQCGVKAGENPICPDVPCNYDRFSSPPPGGYKSGVIVMFSGFTILTIDPSAELMTDPNRSLRCALVSSHPREDLLTGTDSVMEIHVRRSWPENFWWMQAYILTRVQGELYRLMFFLGGGNTWDRVRAGETIRVPNIAKTSGRQAGILANPSGWAEITVDWLA